jgi:hypothetical protein
MLTTVMDIQRHPIIYLVAICGCFLFQGCATYTVKVSSISNPDKPKQSFFLFSADKEITEDDLQFQEFSSQIRRALIHQGFIETDDKKSADTAIAVSYGIGDPKEHQYTYALPVWGKTGYSSAYSFGSVTAYNNSAQYQDTTVYTPTYGVTGYTTQLGTDVTYFRFLKIEAFEVKSLIDKKKWGFRVSRGSLTEVE